MAEQLSLGDKRGVAWRIDDGREPLDLRQRVLEVAGGRAEEAAKSLPPGGPGGGICARAISVSPPH